MSEIRIALDGNPNSGKTTLFNALTGSNQFVGNWPGVTVEKKEGRLKKHDGVILTDLPGIYSLSPYTPEEVIARNYLIDERPDAILNIVDGTNLERNLYLTTQLAELGIPIVIAVNMMDVVKKNNDYINTAELSRHLGCTVVEISALKGTGVAEAANAAVDAAKSGKTAPLHSFSGQVERAVDYMEESFLGDIAEDKKRWYAIKLFERDEKVLERIKLSKSASESMEKEIKAVESMLDDDAESIITNERYNYIGSIIKSCYKKKNKGLTVSDRIDKIVTNRWLGLPIFAVIMALVYMLSMAPGAPGTRLTDWANDGLFGDGWFLLGIGRGAYDEAAKEYSDASDAISAYYELDTEAEDFDAEAAIAQMREVKPDNASAVIETEDEETLETGEKTVYFNAIPADADMENTVGVTYTEAVDYFEKNGFDEPEPSEYGPWVRSIPDIVEGWLDGLNVAEWLKGLILDGIIAGVGAVLGFVPQMLVLFLLLAFLEACGYMARIAFVLDRIFRRFGLSGKSFIPMLVGTGCGIPGIMASRTIENERDRRMTIMTTTFIPCSAKLPFISMVAGAIFGRSVLISVSAYFLGMASIIVSGLMLKKTRMFAGDPAPFVMELPAYHWPTLGNVLRSMWERARSFIIKAGTVILLSTIVVWFLSFFGTVDGVFRMLSEDELENSILAAIGNGIAWIFAPLGWGNWQAAVASFTGLVAKENIVGTMGILYGTGELTVWQTLAQTFNGVTGYSFLAFNLLCAPCFAAIGAIKREMNSARWTWFAIGYQCLFAYAVALMINQFGSVFMGSMNVLGLVAAIAVLAVFIYMLFIKKYGGNELKKRA